MLFHFYACKFNNTQLEKNIWKRCWVLFSGFLTEIKFLNTVLKILKGNSFISATFCLLYRVIDSLILQITEAKYGIKFSIFRDITWIFISL